MNNFFEKTLKVLKLAKSAAINLLFVKLR